MVTIVPPSCGKNFIMKKKKVNWDKIKNEYITSRISYRDLAEKYNVPFQTLRDRAVKEKWFAKRKDFRNKVGTKTEQKQEKIAESRAEVLEDIEQKILEVERDVIIDATNTIKKLMNMNNEYRVSPDYCKVRHSTQKTLESALNTIHKIKYPPENEHDKHVAFVVSKELMEHAK